MQEALFDKEVILVAGCLIGWRCRFHGMETTPRQRLLKWMENETKVVIGVCPEVMAGLPIPRPPARRKADRRLYADGKDVTPYFERAAELTLKLAKAVGATKFYGLKDSPSCCPQKGMTCLLLEKHGIKCMRG